MGSDENEYTRDGTEALMPEDEDIKGQMEIDPARKAKLAIDISRTLAGTLQTLRECGDLPAESEED